MSRKNKEEETTFSNVIIVGVIVLVLMWIGYLAITFFIIPGAADFSAWVNAPAQNAADLHQFEEAVFGCSQDQTGLVALSVPTSTQAVIDRERTEGDNVMLDSGFFAPTTTTRDFASFKRCMASYQDDFGVNPQQGIYVESNDQN